MDRCIQNTVVLKSRTFLLLAAILSMPVITRAERLPIKTYTTADGLPRDLITQIMQDSRGFLWFCTPEGLSRFDGYRFTNYGTEQGLSDRAVNDFIETHNGVYWAATDNGLCRFTPDLPSQSGTTPSPATARFATLYPADDRKARSINTVFEDSSGVIWCGTEAGLYRLDISGGSMVFSHVDIINPTERNGSDVSRIIQDRAGSLWMIATSGLYRLRGDGSVEQFSSEEGLPKDLLQTVMEDRYGRIWVGSKLGLYELVESPSPHHPVIAHVYTKKDGLGDDSVLQLIESADGRVWAATGLGLSVFNIAPNSEASGFRNYNPSSGLSDVNINTVCEDRDRNLWVGTGSGGAMRIAANGLATYGEEDGVLGIRTGAIFEDHAGRLCVLNGNWEGGRYAWLNVLSGARDHPGFKGFRITLPKGILKGSWGWYQVSFQDSAGEWWMVTGEGLARYPKLASAGDISRTPPKAIYTTKDGLPTNDIFRLFEDSRHDIWIGTIGNPKAVLTRWERATETFHTYFSADGIPEASPTAFLEDSAGNLWIGFYNGAFVRYREGRFAALPAIGGTLPGQIRGMYLDNRKRIWAATGEMGVVCIDSPGEPQPGFKRYSKAEGLSSEQATCITQDKWGMMYIGTGRGLDKLDPETGRIRHFTKADGLPSSFVNVAFRDSDGSLWFGTLQGLCRMVPAQEGPSPPPPILITGLNVAGAAYPLPELGAVSLAVQTLGADENNIQIEFSGLSLTAADSLRYQYKLEGAGNEWSAPLDERMVRYPNLPPGSYRFLVRAVNPDGAASDTPAVVSFRILPPIWQRWWFRTIALLALAIPVIAVARFRHLRKKATREAEESERRSREERLAELERVRTRIATDLHDDIGSSLSQIFLLSEVARQRLGGADNGVAEPLTMISSASHEVVSSMSDIVWAINPKKDHLSDLVHRMRRFASDVFAAREIGFRFNAPDSDFDVRLGADIRREVFLIFKESVNNVVRHSCCTEAQIDFQMSENSLILVVRDNGMGFDPCACNEGHGLASLRERARSIGGELDLVSAKGAGTSVTMRLHLS